MKLWALMGKSRILKNEVIGMGVFIAVGLMIHLGTVSARQTAAGQSKQGSMQTRPDGMPINFPYQEPDPIAFDDHTGYVQIFDGTTLNGWDGDPNVWRVENGAIVGEDSKEKPIGKTYIAYRGFEGKDFDLKLEIKNEYGGNTAVAYRSKTGLPWTAKPHPGQPAYDLNWMMTGPQAGYWFPSNHFVSVFTGQLYSDNTPLGIEAWRGQVVQMEPGSSRRLIGNIGDRTALGGYVKVNDWNQYLILARGGTFVHILNGQLMAVLVDDDPIDSNNQPGQIGIEIESAPAKISARNIWLRKF